MTEEEAKIIVLEHALEKARNSLSFLHGCLTNPIYKYAYPEHTLEQIQSIDDLIKFDPSSYCVHSMFKADCEACQKSHAARRKLGEAKKCLKN